MSGATLLWEQHTCLPITTEASVDHLERYTRQGGAYVSVNVGYSPHSAAEVLALLAHFRALIDRHPRLDLAATVADVDAAERSGRTVVAFDLEDSGPLEGDLDRVEEFHGLGIRTLLPTYNRRNAAGSGCLDEVDEGLTRYGRDLAKRMNEVGMTVDGTHCSERAGLELCAVSERPVIYSHSGVRAVWDHPRNITDEQIRDCAATGGVVGIPGVGVFLGRNTATLDAMIRHLDHVVDLVGPEHVGVGSDYVFGIDLVEFTRAVLADPHTFPGLDPAGGTLEFMPPETLLGLGDALAARGYPSASIAAILGGNFRRVAAATWTPNSR
jgi:membrane dipeptidase